MIKAIYTSSEHGQSLNSVQSIELVAGKGIVGDRHFDKNQWPGQNLTLIEREEIDAFNRDCNRSIHESDPRRTLVTENIRLNELVGKEFVIGSVRLQGEELCEPCKGIGDKLATQEMDAAAVVKAFVHKAGLRANVMCDGKIAVGNSVVVDEQ